MRSCHLCCYPQRGIQIKKSYFIWYTSNERNEVSQTGSPLESTNSIIFSCREVDMLNTGDSLPPPPPCVPNLMINENRWNWIMHLSRMFSILRDARDYGGALCHEWAISCGVRGREKGGGGIAGQAVEEARGATEPVSRSLSVEWIVEDCGGTSFSRCKWMTFSDIVDWKITYI